MTRMSLENMSLRDFSSLPSEHKQYEIWDTEIPGLGLRVHRSGRKSWFVRLSNRGRRVTETIGYHPNTDYVLASAWHEIIKEDLEFGSPTLKQQVQQARYVIASLRILLEKTGKLPRSLMKPDLLFLSHYFNVSFEAIIYLINNKFLIPKIEEEYLFFVVNVTKIEDARAPYICIPDPYARSLGTRHRSIGV